MSPAYISTELASVNFQNILLIIFKYFGQLGNCIFVVCSAWFLMESNKIKTLKIWNIVLDTSVFAWIWFAVIFVSGFDLNMYSLIKTVFPILFGNNWFVGCYILLYLIHPGLNMIIQALDKRKFLVVNCIGIVLYSGVATFNGSLYYYNQLVGMILIYFIVAYMKRELHEVSENAKINYIILIIAMVGFLCMILIINAVGLRYGLLVNKMTIASKFTNPFLILISLSIFNLFRRLNLHSKVINTISSVSLLIYVIHEDKLFREKIKPLWWIYIYEKFSYSNVVMWSLFFALICFVVSVIVALIYKLTIKQLVTKLCVWMNRVLGRVFNRLIDWMAMVK